MTKVLVTGAAGFIGSHTCEALLERGYDVIGLDNFDAFYGRAVKEANVRGMQGNPRFRLIEGDITRDALPLDDVSAVFHFAARPGVRPSLADPAGYIEANVTGTVRVLEACRKKGITRIVFASSSSVYGDTTEPPFRETDTAVEPISPYAASKRSAELAAYSFVHLYGLRVICLRFFTVYGPRQRPDLAIHRFTDLIARGAPVPLHGDGSSERDYTYITDALDGILAALDWTGREAGGDWEAVNIGGGSRVRLDRLIALISAALDRPARLDCLPNQPGDVRLTAAGLDHAERLLGYRPRVGIEEGIRHFVRWYKEMHGRKS